jgi:hypothetical protein
MATKERGKIKKHKPPCLLASPRRGNPMRPCTCKRHAAAKP